MIVGAPREVLEHGPERLAGRRDRCLTVRRTMYTWETAAQPYLALVAAIARVAYLGSDRAGAISVAPPPVISAQLWTHSQNTTMSLM